MIVEYDKLDKALSEVRYACFTMESVHDDESLVETLAQEAFVHTYGRIPSGVLSARPREKLSAAADLLFSQTLKEVLGVLGPQRALAILADVFACSDAKTSIEGASVVDDDYQRRRSNRRQERSHARTSIECVSVVDDEYQRKRSNRRQERSHAKTSIEGASVVDDEYQRRRSNRRQERSHAKRGFGNSSISALDTSVDESGPNAEPAA